MTGITVPFFISHRGCPQRCVFCDQERIAGAQGALPAAQEILEKIASYRQSARGRAVEVAFFGGTFTALPRPDQESLLEPLQELVAAGAITGVRVSTRPDAVDPPVAAFLRERGVRTVELGVQSLDDEVLRLSGRGHSAKDTVAAARAVRGAGLALGLQLMPGLPGDSRERSLGTLERALALDPHFLRIYPTLVLEGTALADLYREGSYRPLELEEALSLCKSMLLAALRREVPVIRMGLQPTAELESGVIVAGPYHPAFGQLVSSELYFDLASRLAAPLPAGSRVVLLSAPGRLSDLVGQKRGNLARIEARHQVVVQGAAEDPGLSRAEVALEWEGQKSVAHLLDLTGPGGGRSDKQQEHENYHGQ